MKRILLPFGMFLALSVGAMAVGLVPTNPPPTVSLSWTQSPSLDVTNYFIYWGVASANYTNKVNVGNGSMCTLTLPARGVTYYFNITAYSSNALESAFANEVNWTPAVPPSSASLKAPITLAVQSKVSVTNQWADAGINWSLSPDQAAQMFRLEIVQASPPTAMINTGLRVRREIRMPPLPTSQ